MTSNLSISQPPIRRYRWLSRLMALIAAINLMLVFFNLTYIPWRDVYLQYYPKITQIYDPVKGIEPHRDTQRYLNQVNSLESQLQQTDLESPDIEILLEELRQFSYTIIEENPFALADKSGSLEKIKNLVRDRVNQPSIHAAFNTFWSQAYLAQTGWEKELAFFDHKIKPLIQTNYYRGIDINGKLIDLFGLIDFPFVVLFALDFLIRTVAIKRQNHQSSLLEAILRRWYDLFLLLPFWRWLRVIPVTIRLQQTDLINLEPFRRQINRDFVANFAEEMTEVVGVQMISQLQESIQRGDAGRWLFHPETRRPYIDVNNTDEVQAIATRLLSLSVYDVFPKIQPEIEGLLHQIIEIILKQSPVYQQIKNVPGLNQVPSQLSENLAKELSQTAYKTLTAALEDPVIVKSTARLAKNFQSALELELQKTHNTQEIKTLLVDLLEEIKINYVKRIEERGVEEILTQSSQLRQIIRG
jgi:hypothetical protein